MTVTATAHPVAAGNGQPLFDGPEWTFDLLKKAYDAIEKIGVGELGLNLFPNAIEVITAEQMLDAYSSIGMPHMYRHWSFGKHFARDEAHYRKGQRPLAYELVINSDPCINYIMEENSMTMQTLVLAHAAMGHNHFFKNNYLFREWTRPDAILDYLATSYPGEEVPKINVNEARAIELESGLSLPRSQAAAIVQYRTRNGDFHSIEDLKKVPGVDTAKIEAKKDRLSFK